MDMEQRPLYAPLRESKDFAVWPLHSACNGNCNQGRACDCVTNTDDDTDPTAGMGAIVVPAVVGACLAFAALMAFMGGHL